MEYSVEEVQDYIKSLGYYKEVTFVEEEKDDCIYFDAIRIEDGVIVSVRADVDSEKQVGVEEWFIYECCDVYDWSAIQ